MKLRQQYHFRKSSDGLLAWDVLKLIELSREFEVIEIDLSDISELEELYWNDNGQIPIAKDFANHAKLIMEADISYPIILCSEGRLMDGMHRVCKAYILGEKSIRAVRFPSYIQPDYVGKEPAELPY